ncbi:hypothetical protein [Actinomadura sp. 21ATH]|uniref:SecDF P1 head subdomain-containing protein n=1 Tax=Actinomadura sp. 21ATH TaxID=1735444 RepID=UPI0035C16BEC
MQSDPPPYGAQPPPPPFSPPPSLPPRRTWLIPVLILGTVAVLGAALLGAYALLREKDPADGGPARLKQPVSFVPVRATAAAPCERGWLAEPGSGQCLQVGSGMTIREVEDIRVRPPGSEGRTTHAVTMSFTPADARTFAALTAAAARQPEPANRIAVLAQGEVLAAPTVTAPITGGKVEITGSADRFTRAYTEDLVRRITGG